MAWTERYVRADAAGGGNGTTDTNSGANGAWTFLESLTAVVGGQRVNVRAGTYSNTTNTRTSAVAGTVTAPIWFRGFNTTPGDCDVDPTLARPELTFTTGYLRVNGAFHIYSNLNVTGASTTVGVIRVDLGADVIIDRCKLENTAEATGANAIAAGNRGKISRCYLKSTTTANSIAATTASEQLFFGCVFDGGNVGILQSGQSLSVKNCVFRGQSNYGIHLSAATSRLLDISNCTFYSTGADAIRLTGGPSSGVIINNLFSNITGYGINNASGANLGNLLRVGNVFYSCSLGNENGFGDFPSLSEQTETASPFANAGVGNLALSTTAKARAGGQPQLMENQSYTNYIDAGAVQTDFSPAEIAAYLWTTAGRTTT